MLRALENVLVSDHQRVTLTPKAFSILRYVVERAGRLVTQNELLEALWPDVEDDRLRQDGCGHELPPALSTSPSTNIVGPSVSCIPARVIPVTEVAKWQHQPKLKQRQQQRIPSNAG